MKTQNSQHVALLYTRIQLQTVKHLTSNLIPCRFCISFQISVSYYKITRLSEAGVSTTNNGLYIRQHLVDPFEIMLKLKPIRCWTENTSQLLRTNSRPQNVFPLVLLHEHVQRDFNGRTSGSGRELQVHQTSWTRSGGDQQPEGSCRTESRYLWSLSWTPHPHLG